MDGLIHPSYPIHSARSFAMERGMGRTTVTMDLRSERSPGPGVETSTERVPENGRTETRAGARDADAGDAAAPREDEGAEDATGGDAEGEGVEKDEGVGVKPKNHRISRERIVAFDSIGAGYTQEELSKSLSSVRGGVPQARRRFDGAQTAVSQVRHQALAVP